MHIDKSDRMEQLQNKIENKVLILKYNNFNNFIMKEDIK